MRENGISNFPDPSPDGGLAIDASKLGIAPDSPQFKAAEEACREYMPFGGQPQAPPQEVRDALLSYARCMREHGIANFPDPLPNGGLAIRAGPETGIYPDSPQFQAADEACKQYLPGRGEGRSLNSGPGQ